MGSLAGAAHLLKDNAGVQRQAQVGRKPTVEDKAKSLLDERFSVLTFAAKACPNDPLVNDVLRGNSLYILQSLQLEVSEKLPQG